MCFLFLIQTQKISIIEIWYEVIYLARFTRDLEREVLEQEIISYRVFLVLILYV